MGPSLRVAALQGLGSVTAICAVLWGVVSLVGSYLQLLAIALVLGVLAGCVTWPVLLVLGWRAELRRRRNFPSARVRT